MFERDNNKRNFFQICKEEETKLRVQADEKPESNKFWWEIDQIQQPGEAYMGQVWVVHGDLGKSTQHLVELHPRTIFRLFPKAFDENTGAELKPEERNGGVLTAYSVFVKAFY